MTKSQPLAFQVPYHMHSGNRYFWVVGGSGAIFAYFYAFGHWPNLNDPTDIYRLSQETLSFVKIASINVPLRVGLAVVAAPWVDKNIIQKFK